MRSGSFERGDQPRSVADPDRDAYEKMIRQHNELAARNPAQGPLGAAPAAGSALPRPRGPADAIARGVANVLNEPREARKQLEQHHYGRAAIDSISAIGDLSALGLGLRGLISGHLKVRPPFSWRTKPWQDETGAREWMGDKGIVAKGQDAHHALIPNNGWGKRVPDAVKNQPANIKPMPDRVTHIRIHGNSRQTGLPQFNPLERYWHGTPRWWKAVNAAAAGHLADWAADQGKTKDHQAHPTGPRR